MMQRKTKIQMITILSLSVFGLGGMMNHALKMHEQSKNRVTEYYSGVKPTTSFPLQSVFANLNPFRDPYEEVFDGATVYKICETGSNFNSMISRDNGGRGYGVVLDGRSMMNPDKLPYRELQRLKNLMRKYCPEALYIEKIDR